jgi:hypothetical protein
MQHFSLKIIEKYVEENIGIFHQKRVTRLDSLKLSVVLKRKNPYLFRAKNVLTAEEIIKGLVNAHISSNEETIFGDWLEGLAIFINKQVYKGRKSGIRGVDLEFEKADTRYIISIKSGPNWGNSSQISKMITDFKTAKKILRTSDSTMNIVCVNGCCYGQDNNPDKGDYFKYCGENFWNFISGNNSLYTDLIEPLGYKAKQWNDDFTRLYSQKINKFTLEFGKEYCNFDGSIDWGKLVIFNSASQN